MIQLVAAGKRYGEKILFEGADWQINPGDRIGLVGPNGSGKTTLLRILAGEESLDYGELRATKGIQRGYLPQFGLCLSGRTVLEECLSIFEDLRSVEMELESLTRRLAALDPGSREYAETAERFHRLEHQFRTRDGYALEAQAGAVLHGLGFRKQDWLRPTEEFSGGWQMRLALAKLLLARPNLLLLDEPTNHLDLEARNWLEEYLNSYPYAFVLVSHDRYFLDVTVRRIVELWNRGMQFYEGNYSRFLERKAERRAQMEAAYRNQQERIRQLETFISRFRYQATKARQVQSRIKELERMERIELPPAEDRSIRFSFPQPKASGRLVAELRRASKWYGSLCVFEDVDLVVQRGDRIALVGPNGAGKSTLIRILAGIEPVSSGELVHGHNVVLDYFAQDQYRELDPDARLMDDLSRLAPRMTQTELRSLLGCFLFTENDAFKTVGVLSGGERNRYAIARLLLNPANFLLLDEPTNHLDLRAKDVLLEALQDYTGTLVFVSHDRYFIDRLATRVFEVGHRQVRVYPGNYEDYLWRKSQQAAPTASPAAAAPKPGIALEEPATDLGRTPKRLNPIRVRQMQQRRDEVEEEVARLEARIAEAERELSLFRNAEHTRRLTEELSAMRQTLDQLLAEWEELSRALD